MGKKLVALDVFAMAIKYLVDDLHETVLLRVTGGMDRSEVHWVLTVPAIWTDSAKQFMREAAEKAGIDRHKLSIALEPEAASVYCRHLPVDKTVGHTSVSISSLPVGTRYMIFDAGGGTVDITIHEVTDSGGIKEVRAASGGGWGGVLVDQAFEDLLKVFVGGEVYRKFKLEQTEDWLELMREFEVKKRTVYPEKEGKILIKFPNSLSRMSEQENWQSLEEYIHKSAEYAYQVELINDKMKFTANVFKSLFEQSSSKILQHVTSLIKENSMSVSVILMVGGYSESPMLQNAVRNAFPSMQVIIPSEASTAVLRGALVCGHRPDLVTERVLKYTYGVGVMAKFEDGVHPENKRVLTDTGFYCSSIFSKHAEKGQSMKVGETQVSKTYKPSHTHQILRNYSIYAAETVNPLYTDTDCIEVGSLHVYTFDETELDSEVAVSLTFCGTEIEVEAKIKKSGRRANAILNFLG